MIVGCIASPQPQPYSAAREGGWPGGVDVADRDDAAAVREVQVALDMLRRDASVPAMIAMFFIP
jgi:hypothetical protein